MNIQDWGDRAEGIWGMGWGVLFVYFQKVLSVLDNRENNMIMAGGVTHIINNKEINYFGLDFFWTSAQLCRAV